MDFLPSKKICVNFTIGLILAVILAGYEPVWKAFGPGAIAFALVPIVIITWFRGVRVGLLSVPFLLISLGLLITRFQSAFLFHYLYDDGWVPMTVITLLVVITGHFRDLQKRLKQELEARRKNEEVLQKSEKLFHRMFDQSPVGAAIVGLDYCYERANQVFCDIVGYTQEELRTRTFLDITAPECLDQELELLKQLERGEIDNVQMDKRYIHRSGKTVWVQLSVVLIRTANGKPLNYFPMMVDITQRKLAESSLAKESSINAALVDLSKELMSETSLEDIPEKVLEHAMRLTKSEMGFVGYIDPQTGFLVSTNFSHAPFQMSHDQGQHQVFQSFTGLWGWVLQNQQSLISNNPDQDPRASGTPEGHVPIRRFLSSPAIFNQQLVGQVAVANSPRDYGPSELEIVERLATLYGAAVYQHLLREKFHELSMHDPLTGLHNRRYFEEELERLRGSNRFPVSIIMCDVDQLKLINDNNGHANGDEVLRRASRVLQSGVRSGDLVARIGGDEFVMLLPHTHAKFAALVVRRIYNIMEQDNARNGEPFVMLSLGTASAENQADLDEALKRADSAMYLEKQIHRQRII